jgi:deaminated glutathione amidase
MGSDFKIAVCEMTSVDDVDQNFLQIQNLLSEVVRTGKADLVCFPENSIFFKIGNQKLPAIPLDHPHIKAIGEWAKKNDAYVHLGSIPLAQDGHVYNASVLIEPSGKVSSPYKKIHLFDVDVVGAPAVRESDNFKHGSSPSVFEIHGWKIGSSICYDLRFSELYSQYAKQGVELILIPSAFIVPTGKAHWEILLRARAIESQCYVAAAAQGGKHVGSNGESRETWGHSMIVSPWGEIEAVCQGEPSKNTTESKRVLRATLTKDRIKAVRKQIPMASHRRL